MRTAFKEWAAICRALAAGRQDVILRKGGIVEDGGKFRPEHAAFLLFPTFVHQAPESLVPEARHLLVDLDEGVGLLDLIGLERELADLLGVDVDVVPAQSLKPAIREQVLREAVIL